MKLEGYIKFKRSWLHEEWAKDNRTFKLMVFLLCGMEYTNYAPDYFGHKVKKGQYAIKQNQLSEALGWSYDTTGRVLRKLSGMGVITVERFQYGTIVTICDRVRTDADPSPQSCVPKSATVRSISPQQCGAGVRTDADPEPTKALKSQRKELL